MHADILRLIKKKSGTPTKHTFSDAYLGNNHARYPITIPALRSIAKDWMGAHGHLTTREFTSLLSMLIQAPSSTEKTMAGIMLGHISWLLRSMIRHYPKRVSLYLKENNDSLPKIAIRETLLKLKTGQKTRTISLGS